MFCPKTYLLFIVLRIVVVASAAPVSRSPFAESAAWWVKRYYTNLNTLHLVGRGVELRPLVSKLNTASPICPWP